jgi:hypothetical protein
MVQRDFAGHPSKNLQKSESMPGPFFRSVARAKHTIVREVV